MNSTSTSKEKDFWDKFATIGQFVGAILTPVIIAIIGYYVSSALSRPELEKEYVKLAVETLNQSKESKTPNEMRIWALNVMKKSSPVPIPPALEENVLSIQLETEAYQTGGGFGGGVSLFLESSPLNNLYVKVDGELRAITRSIIKIPSGPHEFVFLKKTGEVLATKKITVPKQPAFIISFNSNSGQILERNYISHGR